MDVNQFLSLFGKEKILKWIFATPNFYFRPTFFFKEFFIKDKEEKISMAIFYSIILVFLLTIFTEKPITLVIKTIIIEIAILVVAFLLLLSNKYLLYKIFNSKIESSNVFYFLWLTKILTIPFQLIFITLFEKTEMYELLFIHNSILALLFIFIIIYSNKIFYKKLSQIIIGVIYNILIFNLFILSTVFIRFDKHKFEFEETIFTDNIYKEFEKKILPLDSLTDKVPMEKFLFKINDKYYLTYSFKKDSILSVSKKITDVIKEGYSFENEIANKTKKSKIDAEIFKFKRNKELYTELKSYLNLLNKDILNPLDTEYTYIIDRKEIYAKNGRKIGEIKHLTMNNSLYKKLLSYNKKRNVFINASNISYYPLNILNVIFYPAIMIIEKNNSA